MMVFLERLQIPISVQLLLRPQEDNELDNSGVFR